MSLTVKLTSDFICPWCLIGERRLFQAINSLPKGVNVDVQWLPFEPNPDMPAQGMDRKTYRSLKFGSWEHSQMLDAQTIAAGRADGITFEYNKINRTPNTFAAHQVSWLAAREGKQHAVVVGLLNGYFTQGWDIGDPEVLVEIAGAAGLGKAAVKQFLDSGEGGKAVRALEVSSRAAAIQGVLHFDIEGTILTGAQKPKSLRQVLIDAHERKADQTVSTQWRTKHEHA